MKTPELQAPERSGSGLAMPASALMLICHATSLGTHRLCAFTAIWTNRKLWKHVRRNGPQSTRKRPSRATNRPWHNGESAAAAASCTYVLLQSGPCCDRLSTEEPAFGSCINVQCEAAAVTVTVNSVEAIHIRMGVGLRERQQSQQRASTAWCPVLSCKS